MILPRDLLTAVRPPRRGRLPRGVLRHPGGGAGGGPAGRRRRTPGWCGSLPAENVHPDRRRRYALAPEALLAAQKAARAEGLDLVGYYHSHPDHPPRPSAADRRDAWPGVSYLIVAVAGGAAGEARSWRLGAGAGGGGDGEGGGGFVEEIIESMADPAGG